jgi:Protein of unknown function (DUF1003)
MDGSEQALRSGGAFSRGGRSDAQAQRVKPATSLIPATRSQRHSPVRAPGKNTSIAGWITLNLALPQLGRAALDPFPFPLLSAAVSTIGLYLAAMILISQRHDDEMATRREQMTLELAILSEQKSAKIIALLEEFRRNDPNQGNDRDEVAEALAKPADAQVVRRDTGCGKGRGQRLDRQNARPVAEPEPPRWRLPRPSRQCVLAIVWPLFTQA